MHCIDRIPERRLPARGLERLRLALPMLLGAVTGCALVQTPSGPDATPVLPAASAEFAAMPVAPSPKAPAANPDGAPAAPAVQAPVAPAAQAPVAPDTGGRSDGAVSAPLSQPSPLASQEARPELGPSVERTDQVAAQATFTPTPPPALAPTPPAGSAPVEPAPPEKSAVKDTVLEVQTPATPSVATSTTAAPEAPSAADRGPGPNETAAALSVAMPSANATVDAPPPSTPLPDPPTAVRSSDALAASPAERAVSTASPPSDALAVPPVDQASPAVEPVTVPNSAPTPTAAAPALETLAWAPPVRPEPPPVKAAEPLARDWTEYRRLAALRMVAANPQGSYTSRPPDPLLAIPVVEVLLQEDGTVEQVLVLRSPSQARDTLRLVEEAIRRSGPFGSVAHLPKPWRFTEVFLFDHARRFKPMILDR